jgi:hypothetical protein
VLASARVQRWEPAEVLRSLLGGELASLERFMLQTRSGSGQLLLRRHLQPTKPRRRRLVLSLSRLRPRCAPGRGVQRGLVDCGPSAPKWKAGRDGGLGSCDEYRQGILSRSSAAVDGCRGHQP